MKIETDSMTITINHTEAKAIHLATGKMTRKSVGCCDVAYEANSRVYQALDVFFKGYSDAN